MEKRKGTKFIKEASSNATQLIQHDNKIYGVKLKNWIPQSVEDLTALIKGGESGNK